MLIAGMAVYGLYRWNELRISVFISRYAAYKSASTANTSLEPFVPNTIKRFKDVVYDPGDRLSVMDVYVPKNTNDRLLPVIIWVQGSAWMQGDKRHLSNYARILSDKGFVVVVGNFAAAPEHHYPYQLRQLLSLLNFVNNHAENYHIDHRKIFLAGNSFGTQLVAQTALVISDSVYADHLHLTSTVVSEQLSGILLFGGYYQLDGKDAKGATDYFLHHALWNYSGTVNYSNDTVFAAASILDHVNTQFPPCFITAGNEDPYEFQSRRLVKRLQTFSVNVDTLFFASDYRPNAPHDYQFDLTAMSGKMALSRSIDFMQRYSNK